MEKSGIVVKTSFGLEDILAEELHSLGVSGITKGVRAVRFTGSQEMLYKVNLWSRVALRVLKPVKKFPAGSEEKLYNGIKSIDWSEYLSSGDTLAVDAVVNHSALT